VSQETAEWLIAQRERRGWNCPEMARQLIRVGQARGERHLPDAASLQRNIYRWEQGNGVSHLFATLYCDAFDVGFDQFPRQRRTRPTSKNGTTFPLGRESGTHDASPGIELPIEFEVTTTAHESSHHASDREQAGIGDLTFEQLRADAMRLSWLTDTGAPRAAFTDGRRVRNRIYRLLDRHLWPREQGDLYFLLACIHALLGQNAIRLGYPDAAEELFRSGWMYANVIDSNALRGMLRAKLSSSKYWRGHLQEASDLAADGLRYVSRGPSAAELQVNYARAIARQGDPGAARHSVGFAHDARGNDFHDELTDLGGNMFNLSLATTRAMAGSALSESRAHGRYAITELESAIALYDVEVPGPGQKHWFGGKALTGVHLAVVRLQTGDLDGAATAMDLALRLPAQQRTTELTTRLASVRHSLVASAYRDSRRAHDLAEQIENFTREAVGRSLRAISG
jgi:hypothetical protein